ncbi:MAG: three-Cys-motif partner protein TcmP [Planctomycetes bacterium]|nr:three-Cys-motif partner protein TcmP [Planctomycetota bacterium]
MSNDQLQLFGGDWTEQKLNILAGYLRAYNNALKKQPFTRVYIDAFAGTGYRQRSRKLIACPGIFQDIEESDAQMFLKGSAKLALEVDPPFNKYVFVESDPEKVAELELLKKSHPDKAGNVEIVQGDANKYVQKYCKNMTSMMRAVVFLDPFATQVEWTTIEAIARTKAIDVWILFPLMAANRLLANDPAKAFRAPLDRIFGTQDWFEQFYCTHKEADIFGQSLETVQKKCNFDSIGKFYLKRLETIFAKVAPKPRIFCNSRGTPLFQLFFAVGNKNGAPIAVNIANHLLEKI